MALIDDGETDWKVIAININDPLAHLLNDVDDVEAQLPGAIHVLQTSPCDLFFWWGVCLFVYSYALFVIVPCFFFSSVIRSSTLSYQAIREYMRLYKVWQGNPENEYALRGEAMHRDYAIRVVEECHKHWYTFFFFLFFGRVRLNNNRKTSFSIGNTWQMHIKPQSRQGIIRQLQLFRMCRLNSILKKKKLHQRISKL